VAVWSNTALSTIETQFGRFDAEFYKPDFLETDRILSAIDAVKLQDVASKIDVGHVGTMVKHYSECGVLLLQTQNVREFFLDLESSVRVTPGFHASLMKSQVHKGDILVARSGSFGSAAIYLENATINSADIIILEIDDPRIDPLYVLTFMNTRHGAAQLVRFASGGVQGHVNLRILGHFRIPLLKPADQESIARKVEKAYSLRKQGEESYMEARQLLESTLGLDTLTFQKAVGYTTQFSDLETSRRSDAQHYQPRFKQLIDHLSAFPIARVREIRSYNRRGLQPIYVNHGSIDVVNSQHLGPKHIDYEGVEKTSTEAFAAAAVAHIRKDDLLIYTTGAYIGRTNVYLSDALAMASNHVNILRLRPGIDAAYMALVFQSVIGQLQTQKHARGSAQAELYPADVDRFFVPLLDPDNQKAIGDLLRESLAKQHESRQLLERAKFRVEQIIEEAVQS
jgi:restriction endonuclease S subunit